MCFRDFLLRFSLHRQSLECSTMYSVLYCTVLYSTYIYRYSALLCCSWGSGPAAGPLARQGMTARKQISFLQVLREMKVCTEYLLFYLPAVIDAGWQRQSVCERSPSEHDNAHGMKDKRDYYCTYPQKIPHMDHGVE